MMTIEECELAKSRLLYCEQHQKYLVIVGCKLCERIYCNMCLIITPNYCFKATGSVKTHQYDPVEKITDKIRQDLRDVSSKLKGRQETLDTIKSEALQISDALQSHKNKCVADSVESQQKQVQEINDKYDVIREELSDSAEETNQHVCRFVQTNREEHEAAIKAMTSLQQCLSDYTVQQLINDKDAVLENINRLISAELTQMEDVPVKMLSPSGANNDANVRCENSSLKSLTAELDLSVLKFTSDTTEPLAPTAPPAPSTLPSVNLSSTLPPPVPSALKLVKTVPVYKSLSSFSTEVYCSYNGVLYSLSNDHLNRYSDAFTRATKTVSQEDTGTFLQAYAGKLYSRQKRGQLVNVYPLHEGLVLPKEQTEHFDWTTTLIESFALSPGNQIVFCENNKTPKLVIFSSCTSTDRRSVEIKRDIGSFQPLYITGGPPGFVSLISKEWIETESKLDMLRLIDIESGTSIWKIALERSCDFYTRPNPITYHNGYIYVLLFTGSMKIIDPHSGSAIKTLRVPIATPFGGAVTISTIYLCVFSDDQFVLPTRQKIHSQGQHLQIENGIALSFWKLQFNNGNDPY